MCQIVFPHWIALRPQLLNRRGHVDGVPDHHGIREEIEAAGLMQLLFLLLSPHGPFLRKA
jgi:hypothetical protein